MNSFFKDKLSLLLRNYGSFRINLPDGSTRRFSLRAAEAIIGRAANSTLVLEHESVSRRHARVRLEGDQLLVEDLASSKGTWVGDQRLQPYKPVPLPAGQPIWIGQVELYFQPYTDEQRSIAGLWITVGILLGLVVGYFLVQRLTPPAFVCEPPNLSLVQPEAQVQAKVLEEGEPTPVPTELALTGTPSGTEGVETPTAEGPTPTAIPPDPFTTIAFLDLPFPYNGTNDCGPGTVEQFQAASQRRSAGGRITSFFDHFSPLYPKTDEFPNGGELDREGEAGHVLLFTGELSALDSYSGHPGYDFSTIEQGKATTPVCAAATGFIEKVGKDSNGGVYVLLRHTVEGLGQVQTFYLHLEPDMYYDDMQKKYLLAQQENVPQWINQYERIGTMGDTGASYGHHLHFEVRFDGNKDGNIAACCERIDPYGYTPGSFKEVDPWTFKSPYMWKHPLGAAATIPGGATGSEPGGGVGGDMGLGSQEIRPQLCYPPGALPAGGTVFFSTSLAPKPGSRYVSVGRAVTISVLDQLRKVVDQFTDPIQIVIPYSSADLQYVDLDTAALYRLDEGIQQWVPLTTTLDAENGLVIATTDRPGQFALLGRPTTDQIPPVTNFILSGPHTENGEYYEAVSIELVPSDFQSEVTKTEFTVKADQSQDWPWETVNPHYIFTLQVPPPNCFLPEQNIEEEGGDALVLGCGHFLILASSTDAAGNVEAPPAQQYLVIDPSKAPAPTPVPALTDRLLSFFLPFFSIP